MFVGFYVATLILLMGLRVPLGNFLGLTAVSVATLASVFLFDRGRWPLGLFVPPGPAVRDLLFGCVWGAALVGTCALLVVLTTEVRHVPGGGFPWGELLLVYVPAALHEELLFRGYFFQKLHRASRWFAILFVAALFGALHASNTAASAIGLTNIFLGGVLLGLAYERYRRLWFPIGIHLSWNLMSGPILGHEVSGYEGAETVLREVGQGALWLTGGEFGIEGSVWMTVVEVAAIALLLRISSARHDVLPSGS